MPGDGHYRGKPSPSDDIPSVAEESEMPDLTPFQDF